MNLHSRFLLPLSLLLFFFWGWQATAQQLTYSLSQSTSATTLWTAPPAEKIFPDSPIPTEQGSAITVYAAANEFEPFLLAVRPTQTTNLAVNVSDFGANITTRIYQVKYIDITTPTDYFGHTGPWPDPLMPVDKGGTVTMTGGSNICFWFNVHVPYGTPGGDYTAEVTIGDLTVPVTLHVFDFSLPKELHVASQFNVSFQEILEKYSVPGTGSEYWFYVDMIKQFFMDHRLTPKSVLWPGGVTSGGAPFIDYDCNGHFTDNDSIWGFEIPAESWLNGSHLENHTGFPTFMAATFVNNDPSTDQRPSTFCNISRTSSDWYSGDNPNSPYNRAWFSTYMHSLQDYLNATGYLDKSYYYFANEPQNQADYDAVAWYSRYMKASAPNLKLAVSEEPKPEIYNHADYLNDHQIDIWIAHHGLHLDPERVKDRLVNHGEQTWLYFLKSTYLPRINPITIDHPGMESKLVGWLLYKLRLRGIAYYQFNNWSTNPWSGDVNPYGQNGERFLIYPPGASGSGAIAYGANNHRLIPSIRLELLRDGLEDYEYLYLLNNGHPGEQETMADSYAALLVSGLATQNRDSHLAYNLRRRLGLLLSGESSLLPTTKPQDVHPRATGSPGDYYLNFQDPVGSPTADPLVVNGKTYTKVGNELYDRDKGYGWLRAADVPAADFYTHWDQWVDPEPKELLGSSVIDDWGREDIFEFDLPNGLYDVTVCAGYRGGTRTHRILLEGEPVIDGETTNGSWITRTHRTYVRDRRLTLQMGMFDEVSFLNYLEIVHRPGSLEDALRTAQIVTGQDVEVDPSDMVRLDLTQDGKVSIDDLVELLGGIANE